MNVLLVNNDTTTENWNELVAVCTALDFNIVTTHHSELLTVDMSRFDLAILSGGWWYDDETELLREYAAELEFINTATIPVFGICIGMQLLHVALDQAVPLLDEEQGGFKEITVTQKGQDLFGLAPTTLVFKNHTRGVVEADPNFDVLAYSPGHVEIIRHQTRPLIGVQFHPESEASIEASKILLQKLITPLVPLPV